MFLKKIVNTIYIKNTPLYNFSKKNIVQGFLMYNGFAKTLQRKVTLYDKNIIQRKDSDW